MAVTKVSLGRQTDLNAASSKITNLLDPTSAQDAASKAYVDSVAAGMDVKASVRLATTAAGTLATSFAAGSVVDGVTLATNDSILIKDQAVGSENGFYTINAGGAPTRRSDSDTTGEVTGGATVWVNEGTANGDTGWTLTTNDTIILGTTSLVFTQTSALGQITTDTTLTKSGSQLARAAITGDITIGTNSNISTIGANKVTLGMQATLAPNSLIGNSTGSAATPTAVPMVTTPTVSSVPFRDTSANTKFNNVISNLTSTATAAGTTTLTVASSEIQILTGTLTQTVVLPDATTLSVGHSYSINNRSTSVVTINANGGGLVQTMAVGASTIITATGIGTAAGTWDSAYSLSTGGGTVSTVSVTSANGFAGTVTNPTSTPAITVSTTVNGLVKGNGTALSAAVVGTDYLAPSSFVDRETPSGTVNGSTTVFILANTPVTGSEHVYLNGILQEPGAGNDYTISGTTITYLTAPLTGDKIRVTYRK